MRLTSLQLPTEALRLDDLSPGLNVAYAPTSEKRRLLPAAVRNALFENTDEGLAARIGIQSAWGGFQLESAEDGHDFHATDSGGAERGGWLRQQLAEAISAATFAAIYTPRLGDPLALDAAMREVCGDEFARTQRERIEALLRELDDTRPWQNRAEVMELRAHQTNLEAQLAQVRDEAQASSGDQQRKAELQTRIESCRSRLDRLQSRIDALTRRIDAQQHLAWTSDRRQQLQPKLDRVSRRVNKVEAMLEELRQQGESLRQRIVVDRREPATAMDAGPYDQLLGVLNHETRRLESHVAQLVSQPASEGPWSAAVEQLVPRLQLLNEKLDLLCTRIHERRVWLSEHSQHSEKLDREYAEIHANRQALEVRLQQLVACRADLLRRIEQASPLPATSPELARLVRRQQKLKSRAARGRQLLGRLEAHLAKRDTTQAIRQEESGARARLTAELAAVQQRLQELDHAERRHTGALLEKLKGFVRERPTPHVLTEASRILHQLSEGEFVGIRPGNSGRDTIVEQPRGKTITCDVLSRAERVQVHLALCLAAAADAARHGAPFPLILNDATRYFPPARLRTVIELLRSYCRASGQVLLLTSQQHVATLCRSLGAASYWLARPAAPARTPSLNIHQPEAADEGSPEPALHLPEVQEQNWDCEEFPGELSDRLRLHQERLSRTRAAELSAEADPLVYPRELTPTSPAAPEPTLPRRRAAPFHHEEEQDLDAYPVEKLRVTGHYLELCDRITESPFLTRRTSRMLEAAGLFTVANFLHAEPARLIERLAGSSLGIAELRQWQAQARLMCGVRRLRGYDARILVACGITTPEQLADIRPDELYAMVEAFVATPEGSRIVRSGNEQEIKRITRWIRGVQHAKRSRGSTHEPKPRRATKVGAQDTPRERRRAVPDTLPVAHPQDRRPAKSAPNSDADQSARSERPRRKSRASATPAAQVIPLKFHLEPSHHVEAAPAIGPSMAKRLQAVGVVTVGQLLACDGAAVAKRLKQRRVTAETVAEWQLLASLVCRVPELRGHDAQILVACGVENPERLAELSPADLFQQVLPFVRSKAGKRVLRSGAEPTLEEVGDWIRWARQARKLDAA